MKINQRNSDSGRWEGFEEKEDALHYIIGVDTASGKFRSNESVAAVLCIETGVQTAILAGQIHPEDIAAEVEKAGYYYNLSEIAVERELNGMTVINSLKDHNYPNLYYHAEPLTAFSQVSREWGWNPRLYRTTAIDWLVQDIGWSMSKIKDEMDRAVYLKDPETIKQFGYFVQNKTSGKLEATSGQLDDRVSAMYIANFVRRERYNRYVKKKEVKK